MTASNGSSAMTLLLADARLPSGAYAHSGGIEQAVDDYVVTDLASLIPFLVGRLHTSGAVGAAVAAHACMEASGPDGRSLDTWATIDAEVSARIMSPSLRATSRRQGQLLLTSGQRIIADKVLPIVAQSAPDGPHLAVIQGVLAQAGGLIPADAALIAAYGTVTSAASAALRLLGLDPVALAAALADLTGAIDRVAAAATVVGNASARSLP